jgi:hypothetical protein
MHITKRPFLLHNLHPAPEMFRKPSIDRSTPSSSCWRSPNRVGTTDYIDFIKYQQNLITISIYLTELFSPKATAFFG